MEETLDSIGEDDELEEEADAEVDKVLFELTDGKLGQAGRVGAELPVRPSLSSLCTGLIRRHRRKMKMRMRKKSPRCVKRCRNYLVDKGGMGLLYVMRSHRFLVLPCNTSTAAFGCSIRVSLAFCWHRGPIELGNSM